MVWLSLWQLLMRQEYRNLSFEEERWLQNTERIDVGEERCSDLTRFNVIQSSAITNIWGEHKNARIIMIIKMRRNPLKGTRAKGINNFEEGTSQRKIRNKE